MEPIYPTVDNIQVREQFHPYRMSTNNLLGNQNRFLYKMSENYRSHHNPVGFFGFIKLLEKKCKENNAATMNATETIAAKVF